MQRTTNEERSFLSPSVHIGGVFDIVVLVALLGTWIGWLGRWFWFFDLFDHFRLQYSVLCLIALLWLGLRRRWKLALFALMSLLANVWPIARTTWVSAPTQTMDASWGLKVVCFNVLTSNGNKAGVIDFLHSQDADIIVLLEVDKVWAEAISALEFTHPHRVTEWRADNFGIALLSRLPLRDAKVRRLGTDDLPTLTAIVERFGRSMLVIATHPIPPMGSEHAISWKSQLHEVRDFASQHRDTPILLVGDFNATPWSQGIGLLRERGQLDFRQPGPAWWPTWNVGKLVMLPIDLAFCSAPLLISDRSIGPDLGSDHRPQVLTLKWAK